MENPPLYFIDGYEELSVKFQPAVEIQQWYYWVSNWIRRDFSSLLLCASFYSKNEVSEVNQSID